MIRSTQDEKPQSSKAITIALYEVTKEGAPLPPRVKTIQADMDSMQKEVGGWYGSMDGPQGLLLWYNDNAVELDLPPSNRQGFPEWLRGSFFLTGIDIESGEMQSVSPRQLLDLGFGQTTKGRWEYLREPDFVKEQEAQRAAHKEAFGIALTKAIQQCEKRRTLMEEWAKERLLSFQKRIQNKEPSFCAMLDGALGFGGATLGGSVCGSLGARATLALLLSEFVRDLDHLLGERRCDRCEEVVLPYEEGRPTRSGLEGLYYELSRGLTPCWEQETPEEGCVVVREVPAAPFRSVRKAATAYGCSEDAVLLAAHVLLLRAMQHREGSRE